MKLASKIFLTIALTFLGLSVALLVLSNRIFLGDYEELESEGAARNVRVISAIQANIESMSALNVDWASWDDTYAFIVDRNPEYMKRRQRSGQASDDLWPEIFVNSASEGIRLSVRWQGVAKALQQTGISVATPNF